MTSTDASGNPDNRQVKKYLIGKTRALVNDYLTHQAQDTDQDGAIYTWKDVEKVLRYFTHVYLWSAIDVDIHYVPSIREYSTRRDIVSVHYEAGDVSDIR